MHFPSPLSPATEAAVEAHAPTRHVERRSRRRSASLAAQKGWRDGVEGAVGRGRGEKSRGSGSLRSLSSQADRKETRAASESLLSAPYGNVSE